MDETIFGDKVDDTMFLRNLHGDRKIVCRFRWEVNIHVLLDECRIRCLMIDLDNMQLYQASVKCQHFITGASNRP